MKRPKKDPRVYLEDILGAIDRIKQYTSNENRTFLSDVMMQDAVILQLAVIGETAKKVPRNLITKHKEIPWKDIVGLRNIIVHDYSQLKIQRLWETIERDLPALKKAIEAILIEIAA